jgi:hypothetical protein
MLKVTGACLLRQNARYVLCIVFVVQFNVSDLASGLRAKFPMTPPKTNMTDLRPNWTLKNSNRKDGFLAF